MIWRRISIESVLKSILSLQMNLCLFPRSNLDSDQNTVVDRKWLELTSISADGIYLFSRSSMKENVNKLADRKWEKFIAISPIEFFRFLHASSKIIWTVLPIES